MRGKAKSPVEFGAKYDMSIDEKGHARLEKISFDAYNECTAFKDVLESYRERTGHYPKRVLVDQIYRTKENREYCERRGVKMSGCRPGGREGTAQGRTDRAEGRHRPHRGRALRQSRQRCFGAGLITTRLAETTLGRIALSVLVANLFGAGLSFLSSISRTPRTAFRPSILLRRRKMPPNPPTPHFQVPRSGRRAARVRTRSKNTPLMG